MLESDLRTTGQSRDTAGAPHPLPLQVLDPDAPEDLPAVKQLLVSLDKTFKTARTYGPTNPVAQRFFQHFYHDLTAYLNLSQSLPFLVHRAELYYKGYVVYHTSTPTENLAFKLYADGIRELVLSQGLTQNDLAYFLDALSNANDPEVSDDDIVTRLWEKNLATISFVTAEESIKSAEAAEFLTPQDAKTLNSPISGLLSIAAGEQAHRSKEAGAPSGQAAPVGYDVTSDEVKKLAQEIDAETSRDHVVYLLDMLTAILASEQSTALLSKLLDLFADILGMLTKQGNWKLLNTIVSLLQESQELCPNLADEHKRQLQDLCESLGRPERIKVLEELLNADGDTPTEDVQTLLMMLKAAAVPELCAMMGRLTHRPHRMMMCEVLTTLAKQNPTPLVKGLRDPRWYYVRNVALIIGKLHNPQLAKPLEPLLAHSDPRVRKEALRSFRVLCPSGSGEPFVRLLNDQEESIRLLAVKILSGGQYTAPFAAWSQVVLPKTFQNRSLTEKQAIFQAMCHAVGEDVVPYCRQLVTKWFWTHRKQHQEAGVLAAEALARIGSLAAIAALEAGKKRLNRVIRLACAKALATRAERRET